MQLDFRLKEIMHEFALEKCVSLWLWDSDHEMHSSGFFVIIFFFLIQELINVENYETCQIQYIF